MLSLHGKIPTAPTSDAYIKIGAGACGIIFSQLRVSIVVKLAKFDNHGALWNDYKYHALIAIQFGAYANIVDHVKIPKCYFFVPKEDPHFFADNPGLVNAAKEGCSVPTSALVTERIWPPPKPVRHLLISKYCSPGNKEKAMADPANNDCLVRPYLGSWHGKSGGMFFSLRNFKLHLNQMVQIQLDVERIARRMAVTMALMHWAARTDARDVEFVLGCSRQKSPPSPPPLDDEALDRLEPFSYTGPPSRNLEDFSPQTPELWVLDFNQVRPITLDEAGVAQAVEAAKINDPYIPRPLRESPEEKRVWNAFVVRYLDASETILKGQGYEEKILALPAKFLQRLVEVCKK